MDNGCKAIQHFLKMVIVPVKKVPVCHDLIYKVCKPIVIIFMLFKLVYMIEKLISGEL